MINEKPIIDVLLDDLEKAFPTKLSVVPKYKDNHQFILTEAICNQAHNAMKDYIKEWYKNKLA